VSEETYGAWLATGNILVWITAVDPGLTVVLEQRVASAYGDKNYGRVQNLITSGLLISAVIALLIAGTGLTLSTVVTSWIKLGSVDAELITSAFQVAVSGTALTVFSYGLYGISKGLQGTLVSGIILVVKKALDISIVVGLLYAGYGLMAIPWSKVAGGGFLVAGNAIYLLWRMTRENKVTLRRVSGRKVIALARLMAYNLFGRASNVIATNVDSFIVGRYIGSDTVALYRLTKKAPDLVKKFINRASVAFMPATSHIWGEGDIERAREVLLRVLRYLTWGLGITMTGLLTFNDDFVRLWVGSHLYAGRQLNALICILVAVLILTKSISNLCYSLGNIKGNSIASGVQSILYIVLSVVGVVCFDLTGLILGGIISHITITMWYYPYKISEILDFDISETKSILLEFFISLGTGLIIYLLFDNLNAIKWYYFAIHILTFSISYLSVLSFASGKFREELRQISHLIK
jgi:O-antigen/teichoic acid export membrane protein